MKKRLEQILNKDDPFSEPSPERKDHVKKAKNALIYLARSGYESRVDYAKKIFEDIVNNYSRELAESKGFLERLKEGPSRIFRKKGIALEELEEAGKLLNVLREGYKKALAVKEEKSKEDTKRLLSKEGYLLGIKNIVNGLIKEVSYLNERARKEKYSEERIEAVLGRYRIKSKGSLIEGLVNNVIRDAKKCYAVKESKK